MGLRVSAEMKRRLEKDAVKAGRSLSQEAEIRLEQSYDRQWILEYLTKLLGKSEE
jgi:hypothetical protein